MISYEMEGTTRVEILEENVCFRIDSKFGSEYALALLAALQCYIRDCQAKTVSWNKIHKQNRRFILNLMLACEKKQLLDFLFTWLSKEQIAKFRVVNDLESFNVSNFDYYVDISKEKVLNLVTVGNLHFHQGVGILLGCDSRSLANLDIGAYSFESGTVVLVGVEDLIPPSQYESLFGNKFKQMIVISPESQESLDGKIIDTIRGAEAVIGRRGFAVYAASCLKKPVVELVDLHENFSLLTQWSNKHYVPIILDQPFDPAKGAAKLWETVTSFRATTISKITVDTQSEVVE